MEKFPGYGKESLKKITFLRSGKYCIHPAMGPIIAHEAGDKAMYPLTFCNDMVEAGAAKWAKMDPSDEEIEEEKKEVKAIKQTEAQKKKEKAEFDKKKRKFLEGVEVILADCKSTTDKKARLVEWAQEKHGVKLNKNFNITKMLNDLVKEVL